MFEKLIIVCIFFTAFNIDTKAQMAEKIHSPRKASILSAIIPGSGQYYNRKYWKVPLIYMSIGTALYIAKWNQNEYKTYRKAYEYRTDGYEETVDLYLNQYSEANLKTIKDYHRKNRDLAYIITASLYALNIIDASVDAHLFNFNISEDLSFNIHNSNSNNKFGLSNIFTITLNLN
tara:strand:- start:332 stop:859 length:528 start_codon:yes stop_codon:yes gene_type:complete